MSDWSPDEQIALLQRLEVWIGKVSKIFEEKGCGPIEVKEVFWTDDEYQAYQERCRNPVAGLWTYPERRRRYRRR